MSRSHRRQIRTAPRRLVCRAPQCRGQRDRAPARPAAGARRRPRARSPGRRALLEAMRYASLGGGKRLRPFLTVESAALFGVRREHALMAGAAIELRALLLAGARRPAGDGRRRPAPRPADRAQGVRRGDRDPRRRRPAHLRLRRARPARDPSRRRGPRRAGHRACARRGPRRHGRRADARPRRRRPLRQERHAAGREGRADAASDEDRRDPEFLLHRRRDPRQRAEGQARGADPLRPGDRPGVPDRRRPARRRGRCRDARQGRRQGCRARQGDAGRSARRCRARAHGSSSS